MTEQAPPLTELAERSVTRNDIVYEQPAEAPSPPGILYFNFFASPSRTVEVLPIDLPPPWGRPRDYILASTIQHNTMWAAAVNWAITKMVASDWTVKDVAGSERRTGRARTTLLQANMGRGWAHYLSQNLADFLLTDNGCFTEIIWSTLRWRRDAKGRLLPVGQVIGIQHLDSLRCTRLDDNDLYPFRDAIAAYWNIEPREVHAGNFPVIYLDLAGRPHLLWRWQVMDASDMTSPRTELRGTGTSAAARAYHAIFKDTALERYVSEKITGDTPKEIHLVSGIMSQQFEQANRAARDQRRSENRQVYPGVVVIPGIKPDAAVSGYRIPIAEIPDGFDPQQERDNTYIKYARALGLPTRDLAPAPAGLNSGQSAVVEAEQASGVGLAAWRKWFVHALNQWVLPASTQFEWTGDNLSDAKARAEIFKLRAEARKLMIEAGEITARQSLQMAVDSEDAPAEFLPEDGTPQDELRDDEKPIEDGERGEVAAEETPAAQPTLRDLLRQKADEPGPEVEQAIDQVYGEAVAWARAAMTGVK
jgi:hypothetical protein